MYGPGGVSANNCNNVHIEDVQLYSIPGMGFVMHQTKDATVKNCGVRFRGGVGGRPMSITADASHFNECSGTIHLDTVHFEGQGDDGCNVHGMFHDVRSVAVAATNETFELGSRPAGGTSPMNVGHRYEFRNRDNWTIEGVGSCIATSVIAGKQRATFEWEAGSGPISRFALLTDISLQPSVVIEHSHFSRNRARGTLVKTSNVLLRNNTFDFPAAHCILAFPDGCYWFESGGFRNWSIINNTFNGCGAESSQADIFVAACGPTYDAQGLPTKNGAPIKVGQPFSAGKVIGNQFLQHDEPHHAVEMYGFNGLEVLNNTIKLIESSRLNAFLNHSGLATDVLTTLCTDFCGNFDGFDVSQDDGARVFGWVVDAGLRHGNVSSLVSVSVDGVEVISGVVADGLRPDLVGKVCKEPQHGFDFDLPQSVAASLLAGNHTLAVLAMRENGTKVQINKRLFCSNKERRTCAFPQNCQCGGPLPSRMLISNSVSCSSHSNSCDGKACAPSTPVGGCKG